MEKIHRALDTGGDAMLRWGAIKAWNGFRLNPNGKSRLKGNLGDPVTASSILALLVRITSEVETARELSTGLAERRGSRQTPPLESGLA